MSVKFTPGPHPSTSRPKSQSPNPQLQTPLPPTSPIPPVPNNSPNQPLTPSPISFRTHPRRHDLPTASEAERQPLIANRDVNRSRLFYPIVIGLMVFLVLGAVIGLGGWRLGMGAGGGRWPGGPH